MGMHLLQEGAFGRRRSCQARRVLGGRLSRAWFMTCWSLVSRWFKHSHRSGQNVQDPSVLDRTFWAEGAAEEKTVWFLKVLGCSRRTGTTKALDLSKSSKQEAAVFIKSGLWKPFADQMTAAKKNC